MERAKLYAVIVIAILWCCISMNALANENVVKAVAAAKIWLALVDQGRYGESWETAAEYFKQAITKDKWEQTITAVRRPMGRMLSRKLLSNTYTQSLPGAPDGEYVVIQFETSFKNKKSGIETVTPMLDKDGKWKVSGYYIK